MDYRTQEMEVAANTPIEYLYTTKTYKREFGYYPSGKYTETNTYFTPHYDYGTKKIKKLIKQKIPVTKKAIINAANMCNYKIMEILLSVSENKLDNFKQIIDEALVIVTQLNNEIIDTKTCRFHKSRGITIYKYDRKSIADILLTYGATLDNTIIVNTVDSCDNFCDKLNVLSSAYEHYQLPPHLQPPNF
jgi:hypothetical protein